MNQVKKIGLIFALLSSGMLFTSTQVSAHESYDYFDYEPTWHGSWSIQYHYPPRHVRHYHTHKHHGHHHKKHRRIHKHHGHQHKTRHHKKHHHGHHKSHGKRKIIHKRIQ